MIKVYLDSCVYQELKKETNKALLNRIVNAKRNIVFCFSEAHLHDLNRDKTDEKFKDMDFIESIAENHCFYIDKRAKFSYLTPKEYYEGFDWNAPFELGGDPLIDGLLQMFKNIPLSFKELMPAENNSGHMTNSMFDLLQKPNNLYEFMEEMLKYSDKLNDHKEFKEHLRVLHANSQMPNIDTATEIEGYDGTKVTDKEKFRNSFTKRFLQEGKEKPLHDLYSDLYHGLEVFGFVKGKPKKQKMMNLIDDARHSFFGAHCDIVVSKDEDFLAKTRFLYDVVEIKTQIVSFDDFANVLDIIEADDALLLNDLATNINQPILKEMEIGDDTNGNIGTVVVRLPHKYFSYFNALAYIGSPAGVFFSFTQEYISYSTGTLTKQIEFVTNKFAVLLGQDCNGRREFNNSEIENDSWPGRCWIIDEMMITLRLDNKLSLNIYSKEYLEASMAYENDRKTA